MNTEQAEKKCQPLHLKENGDWQEPYIVAMLKIKGTNLKKLSEQHGYKSNGLQNALHRKYPKAEKIIADAIGVHPSEIWTSRY